MQLPYPPALQAFADEIRDFVRAELPAETRDAVLRFKKLTREQQVDWQRRLCARGFACPSWPVEHGGPGWSPLQRHVFDEVTSEEGAPQLLPFGESMLAPVIMKVGTADQKARFLPRIRTLDYWFCQGFSEPGAGSDLAALRTRAVPDGDHFVVTGQKMWTSFAHLANWIFCLVRTSSEGKPQEGITMLVFPMDLPGITVRPVITIEGAHSTNEVFLDEVRVPRDGLIGEIDKGWTYAKLLLAHERTAIARIGQSRREINRLKALARAMELTDPVLHREIARTEIDLAALSLTAIRMLDGGDPALEAYGANVLKVRGSEIQQRLTELFLEALGPLALPMDPARGGNGSALADYEPEIGLVAAPSYLTARVLSIYGGSNEIQRNIIAKAVGL